MSSAVLSHPRPWHKRLPDWMRLSTRAGETFWLSVAIAAIAVVELYFVYGNAAIGAVFALFLALGMAAVAALGRCRAPFTRCVESLALIPLYILLTASLPWFFVDQHLLLPAVYAPVIALCLWYVQGRRLSFLALLGLRQGLRLVWKPVLLGVAVGIPTGALEYLVLLPAAPTPQLHWGYFWRDVVHMVFFVGLGEELLFRGLIQRDISRALGWKAGLFLASFVFMVMHLSWRSIPELGFVFLAGSLMGVFMLRTGNLAGSIALHASNNVVLVSVSPYVVPYLVTLF